jgi:hypothetical protein
MTYNNGSQFRTVVRITMATWVVAVLGVGCVNQIDSPDAGASGAGGAAGGNGPAGAGGGAGRGSGGGAGSGGSGGVVGTGGVGAGGAAGAGTGGRIGTGGSGAGGAAGAGAGGRIGTGGSAAGGAAGAGTGGTLGTGGSAAGGATGTVSCLNGRMDGSETGVDCGGSCPACPNYMIAAPNLRNNSTSGCSGGNGYMCARSMAFSPEFKQAAKDDWSSSDPPFVYGVVGHDLDAGGVDGNFFNSCCQCYQLVFESPRDAVSGVPTPKPMIVQTFNTAAGGGKNFDVYMAAGGYGANNGCFGGSAPMYSSFPTVGEPGLGGVRTINFPQQCSMNGYTNTSISTTTCQDQIASQCMTIQSTSSAMNQSTSQISCQEANQPANLYHLNWNVRAKRVECPTNLTRVTGCKLAAQGLPQADPTAKDVASASGFATGYTTTTMQDCCRPTCAFSGNVTRTNNPPADGAYGAFYTCDLAGNPS